MLSTGMGQYTLPAMIVKSRLKRTFNLLSSNAFHRHKKSHRHTVCFSRPNSIGLAWPGRTDDNHQIHIEKMFASMNTLAAGTPAQYGLLPTTPPATDVG